MGIPRLSVLPKRWINSNKYEYLVSSYCRAFCNTNAPTNDVPVPSYIVKFNDSISANVMVTVPLFLGIRNATWYGLVFAISQTASVCPELGIAYMITKVTGKFRQPVNVMLAAGISKTFPVLSNIKASALFGAVHAEFTEKHPEPPTTLDKVAKWLSGPLDKYGFSYYLASKVSVFSSVSGLAVLIRYGVDMSSLLTTLGVGDAIQSAGGAMGAATMINTLILPLHMLFLMHTLPIINSLGETRKIG